MTDDFLDRLRRQASIHEADAERERQHFERHYYKMHESLDARNELLELVADVMVAREKAEALDG